MPQPRSGFNPPVDASKRFPLPPRDEEMTDDNLRQHDGEIGYSQRGMDRFDPGPE